MPPGFFGNSPYDQFAASVTPQWRREEFAPSYPSQSIIHVVDISSTGHVHRSHLQLTKRESVPLEVEEYTAEYLTRLEAERQALKTERGDIKTRLVVYAGHHYDDGFVRDLYGVEFGIEPSFFNAYDRDNYLRLFPEEDPPSFLQFGRGWRAKFVDLECDHPLIKKGVTISKGNRSLKDILCLMGFSPDLFA
jgi:hypothetical protein